MERGVVMMQVAVAVILFVIALLLEEVNALGVVSSHVLDSRDGFRLERDVCIRTWQYPSTGA